MTGEPPQAGSQPPEGANVTVHLRVSRPEREYLPELLRSRLWWDPYAGHMYVVRVDVRGEESPFPPGTAEAAIAELRSESIPSYPLS